MMLAVKGIFWCSLAVTILYIYRKWNAYRAFRSATIQRGCKPPKKFPHTDTIWGSDLVKKRAMAAKSGHQMDLFMKHFDLCGKTFEENFHGTRVINTMEACNIQQITALGFQDYGKMSQKNFKPLLGSGIFSQEGAIWRHSRDLVKPMFSRSEVSDVDSLDLHVSRLLQMIPGDGSTIDLQVPLHKMFLDISTEFLFGKSTESLLPDDPNNSAAFIQAFNEALMGVGKRRLAGKLSPIVFAFDKSWKRACDKVHAWVDVHVKRALDEASKGEQSREKPQTRYILLNEMAKQIKDPVELRFQILNVFLPARDSTSILVGNALFHLARNPEIWTELRKESLRLGNRELSFEVLKSLLQFQYVIRETVRLQGPSGQVRRVARCNTILPSGGGEDGKSPVFVDEGTIVALNLWGLHHDRDIWGEDVLKFNPQRWAEKRLPWDFVPFLGGPRICPAQQQVLTQAVYLLVRMTREFEKIDNRDTAMEYVELTKMTTESRNGIKVALFRTELN